MHAIVISADDYAYHQAVDDGILGLIEQGRLTATSCMVMSPRWPEAAHKLNASIRQQADIGLHLDFTEFGAPLRKPLPALMLSSFLHSLPITGIQQNISVQLQRFEDAMGTPPDYIDGHQHVHQLPQIRHALLAALRDRYQDQGPWLRISSPPTADGLKGRIIHALGARPLQLLARRQGLKCSDQLLGVYDFHDTSMPYLQRLRRCLQQAINCKGLPVLMCHPALPGGAIYANDPILSMRGLEFSSLQSSAFKDLLEEFAITPVRGSIALQ